ncbi:MAG: MerR family transcriptional regulator [Anaerolineales bacterium]
MKISKVSEKFDISPDTLRYYERVGLIPSVNRTESGIRDFNQTDVEWVEFIKCMRSAGLTIEVLTEYVELVQQGDHTNAARKQILIDQRDELVRKMEEMQKTLDLLNYKIEVYEERLMKKEKEILQLENRK